MDVTHYIAKTVTEMCDVNGLDKQEVMNCIDALLEQVHTSPKCKGAPRLFLPIIDALCTIRMGEEHVIPNLVGGKRSSPDVAKLQLKEMRNQLDQGVFPFERFLNPSKKILHNLNGRYNLKEISVAAHAAILIYSLPENLRDL